MREYQTQDNYKPGVGFTPDKELNSEDITERDGYRPTERIVMDFIQAGERLAQFRKDEFDREMEDEDLDLPIGREQGFEMADASMTMELEAKRIAALKPDPIVEEKPIEKAAENGST